MKVRKEVVASHPSRSASATTSHNSLRTAEERKEIKVSEEFVALLLDVCSARNVRIAVIIPVQKRHYPSRFATDEHVHQRCYAANRIATMI